MPQPVVTAIVSTYNAAQFMRGCLESLVAQTMFDDIEVIVIDSGSPQDESAICNEFVGLHPQIRLIRTEREPLYAAWNRAIGMARGKYLTNANTDDRHRPDFMERMVQALDDHPEVALVYADQLVSKTRNETHAMCVARKAVHRVSAEFSHRELLLNCIIGSQPMWRRALHDEMGLFDTHYRVAADQEMWLRFACKYDLLHIREALGVLYDAADTISGGNNQSLLNQEVMRIQQTYLAHPTWRDMPGLRKRLAADIFGRGYQRITRDNNMRAAQPFFREAVRLDPWNIRFRKTYVLRSVLMLAQKS